MRDKNVNLLPHNEEAFKKLKNCLEDNQFVAINHATGTGKSFIILKYLYENRDKRILFLSPSYPINDQLVNEHMSELGINFQEFSKFDTLIYRSLLGIDMEKIANDYDIIVLDEYHRCGAKKWGLKVNELLDCIKEKHSEKKVVGTTATEIRYLDNEKNMNNILFDGVCASTLTLADAMLRGILPVPVYINSAVEVSFEYEKLLSKVNRKTLYNGERDYYLKLIDGVRRQIDEILEKDEDIKKIIKRDGKHLVFSSTIKSIEDNKKLINRLLSCKHNKYVVHSEKSKKENAEILKKFRYDKDPAVLYCINILNEGVHVKGVDSIFMLRPTTSPIIFFQQLGRLLSYSRRKDKVCVFDLVNNLRHSPHIYKLYIDLYQRANELIEIEPSNKEHYLNIVNSFKIVDSTSKVYDKLDILKNALLNENFYKKRIDFIIEILQRKIVVNEVEEKIAKMELFKYYKYITLDQYRVIKNINVNKPAIFNLSEKEFIDMLSGEENIYQKEKKVVLLTVSKVNNFYEKNCYFPSVLGKSMEEQFLANSLIKIYITNGIEENIFENKNLDNLTEYEKIIYGISKSVDFNKLYNEIDILIGNGSDIYTTVISVIQSEKTDISKIYVDKIFRYNANRNNIVGVEENNEDKTDKNIQILYSESYQMIAKECMKELENYESIDIYLKEFSDEMVAYIIDNKTMPVYYKNGINELELMKMRRLYIKKMIFYQELLNLGYIDLFNQVYNSVQLELVKLNKDNVLKKLVEFLKEHNGDMPSLNLDNDRELALEFNRIKAVLNDDDISLISKYKSNSRTMDVVLKYVAFVKKYRRYPLVNSSNEVEKMILIDYMRNEAYFSKNERNIINDLKKVVNSREAMKNAYAELIKQKNRSR